MLCRMILAGLSLATTLALTPRDALAQSPGDAFLGAARLSPDGVASLPHPDRFYATLTSHGGKYVLSNSTRVMASALKPKASNPQELERVNDGVVTIPPIDWSFRTYQLDFLGSQTPSGVNRVYLAQLTEAVAGCSPCFTIHRTIEQTGSVTGQLDWTLGTIGATGANGQPWDGVYLGGKEVQGPGGYTKTLAVGTPVWQRRSSPDQPVSGSAFSNNRLVLKPTSSASTDWQIAELAADNTFTGNILSLTAFPNELFGLVQVVRQSDWNRYTLVPAANANAAMTTFEVRRPVGIVAAVPFALQGKPGIDHTLYNIDVDVTVKSRDVFAGMAGIAFTLNADPLTSLNQRFSYPGFIAFVPQLPERLAVQIDGKWLQFPLDYNGTFPGLVFGIRGATGTCAERGMLDYPTAGISEFLASSDDKTGAWMVCSLSWWWDVNKAYRLRLWATSPARSWGAWVSNADGSDERNIGVLTIPADPTGHADPRIAAAGAFVRVNAPQACDKVGAIEVTIDKLVADAGQQTLVMSTPSNSAGQCPGLKAVASCQGSGCTLGVQ